MNRREYIEGFKESITEWLTAKEWGVGERYPFEGIEPFMNEAQTKLGEWGIQWSGWVGFGETVTIGGEWPELGVGLEINFNPIEAENHTEFRVLYRWR